MSNYNNITIEKNIVEDFISIESGTEKITLTIFKGLPKQMISIYLDTNQITELVKSLEYHRELILKGGL